MAYNFAELNEDFINAEYDYEQSGGKKKPSKSSPTSVKKESKKPKSAPKPSSKPSSKSLSKPKKQLGGNNEDYDYDYESVLQNGGGDMSDFDWVSIANLAVPFVLLWTANEMKKSGSKRMSSPQKGGSMHNMMGLVSPNDILKETQDMLTKMNT